MKSFAEFLLEGTKLVKDGSVMNVHHNGSHIGNIMDTTKNGYKHIAYSNHWSMKQLHKSKSAAVKWLVDTHEQAMKS